MGPWGRWTMAGLLGWAAAAGAGEWRLQPDVSVQAVYTDNLGLQPAGAETGQLIGELAPGLQVQGEGARQRTRLAYQAQGLLYPGRAGLNRVYHRLDARSELEPWLGRLDVDLSARRYQRSTSILGRVPLDNLNAVDRDRITVLSAAPTLRLGTGRYVDAALGYRWGLSRSTSRALADGMQNAFTLSAVQGRAFAHTRWSFQASRQDVRQRRRGRFLRDAAQATVDHRLVGAWGLVLRGGYVNDRIPERYTINNGGYASAGLSWRPSPRLQAEATAGYRNRDAYLAFAPTRRTSLTARWTNRSVGLLAGTTLSASFRQAIRRLSLRLDYGRTAGNQQLLQLQGRQFFLLIDRQGQPVLDVRGFPVILFQDVFSLTDRTFIQRQGRLSLLYARPRSQWLLAAFQSRRRLLGGGETQRAAGATGSVRWRAGARTTVSLRLERTHLGEVAGAVRYGTGELRLERRLSSRAGATAALTRYVREGTGASWREHRLMVGWHLSF